jgi:phosphoglycolate phosphatase-like HAD superfamily hydrolase
MERRMVAEQPPTWKLRAVLFDLDGVLVDSRRATAQFFQQILKAHGYPVPPRHRCDAVYHLPAITALAELCHERDPEQLSTLARAVSSEQYPLGLVEAEKDAASVLGQLANNYRLGIVSSRIRAGIVEVVGNLLDLEMFETIVGFEDTTRHKPHAAPLLEAMARLGVDSRETVYVGDSDSDVAAARDAGAFSVRYGPVAEEEEADASIGDLKELLAVLPGAEWGDSNV